MTLKERVIVSAYTGYLMVQGEELKYLYEYAEKVTGRKGWQTIDFAEAELLQNRSKADFLRLCEGNYSVFNHEDFDKLEKMVADDPELKDRYSSITLAGGQREIRLWDKKDEYGCCGMMEAAREYSRGLALWEQRYEEFEGHKICRTVPLTGLISPEEVFKRWKEKAVSQ